MMGKIIVMLTFVIKNIVTCSSTEAQCGPPTAAADRIHVSCTIIGRTTQKSTKSASGLAKLTDCRTRGAVTKVVCMVLLARDTCPPTITH